MLLLIALVLFSTLVSEGDCQRTDANTFREDNRCGKQNPLSNGMPSTCDAKSDSPCCSEYGWCGSGEDYCRCSKCKDFREVEVNDLRCKFKAECDGERTGRDILATKLGVKTENKCVDRCLELAVFHPEINGVAALYEDDEITECWCEQQVVKENHYNYINGTKFCMLKKEGYVCDGTPEKPVRRCGLVGVDETTCQTTLGCCFKGDADDELFPKCYHGKKLKSAAEGDASKKSKKSKKLDHNNQRRSGPSNEEKINLNIVRISKSLAGDDDLKFADNIEFSHQNLINGWKDFKAACELNTNCSADESIAADKFEKVANGLEAMSSLTEAFENVLKHKNPFKRILDAVGPFLGTFGAAVTLVSSLLNTDSSEAQAIKKLTNLVNLGFAKIEKDLTAIETRINLVGHKVDALTSRSAIQVEITKILDAKKAFKQVQNNIDVFKEEDIKSSFSAYIGRSGCKRIVDAISSIKRIIDGTGALQSTPYCEHLIKTTEIHRELVVAQLTRVFTYMLLGTSTYVQMKAQLGEDVNSGLYNVDYQDMNATLHETLKKIEECDNDIKNNRWKDQWISEIDPLAKEYMTIEGNEEAIASTVFQHYSKKYSWRIWMVWVWKKEWEYQTKHYISCTPEPRDFEKHYRVSGHYLIYIINLEKPSSKPNHYPMTNTLHFGIGRYDLFEDDIAKTFWTKFNEYINNYHHEYVDASRCLGVVHEDVGFAYTDGYCYHNNTKEYPEQQSTINIVPRGPRFVIFQVGSV